MGGKVGGKVVTWTKRNPRATRLILRIVIKLITNGNLDIGDIDFGDIDTSGIDASSIDMSGIDVSGIDISGLDYSGSGMKTGNTTFDTSTFDTNGFDISGGVDITSCSTQLGFDTTGTTLDFGITDFTDDGSNFDYSGT